MGRWGEPAARSARERTIAVRMKQPAKTFQTTPENVGKENGCIRPDWRSSDMSMKATSSVRPMAYQALRAMMPKFGHVVIGIPCRGGLGGDKDEQA